MAISTRSASALLFTFGPLSVSILLSPGGDRRAAKPSSKALALALVGVWEDGLRVAPQAADGRIQELDPDSEHYHDMRAAVAIKETSLCCHALITGSIPTGRPGVFSATNGKPDFAPKTSWSTEKSTPYIVSFSMRDSI